MSFPVRFQAVEALVSWLIFIADFIEGRRDPTGYRPPDEFLVEVMGLNPDFLCVRPLGGDKRTRRYRFSFCIEMQDGHGPIYRETCVVLRSDKTQRRPIIYHNLLSQVNWIGEIPAPQQVLAKDPFHYEQYLRLLRGRRSSQAA